MLLFRKAQGFVVCLGLFALCGLLQAQQAEAQASSSIQQVAPLSVTITRKDGDTQMRDYSFAGTTLFLKDSAPTAPKTVGKKQSAFTVWYEWPSATVATDVLTPTGVTLLNAISTVHGFHSLQAGKDDRGEQVFRVMSDAKSDVEAADFQRDVVKSIEALTHRKVSLTEVMVLGK